MKKYVLLFAIILFVASCVGKYGRGGKNACQFVKERVPELRDDIKSIEVMEEDSLLSDLGIMFAERQLSEKGKEYLEGKISGKELDGFLDSVAHDASDVEFSWRFGNVVNDSLKQLKKYAGMWRKAYKVRVTMKSGTTREPHVLMDNDGVTPRMLDKDMERTIEEHTKHILEVQEYLSLY